MRIVFGSVLVLTACSSFDSPNSDAQDAADDPWVASSHATIGRIDVYQSIGMPLFANGEVIAPALPIVAGKDMLVRVHVSLKPNAPSPLSLQATLHAASLPSPLLVSGAIDHASVESDLDSTFNFYLTAETMRAETFSFRVELEDREASSAESDAPAQDAMFPRTAAGTEQSLHTLTLAPATKIRVVIVPIAYDADGSGRAPDLGPAMIEAYRGAVHTRFPASDVELTVRETVASTIAIEWDGQSLPSQEQLDAKSQTLQLVTDLRATDAPADDVYYVGIINPWSFCTNDVTPGLAYSCYTGLAWAPDINEPLTRAALISGYPGPKTIETFAHELGHLHGQSHAPGCGTLPPVDLSYPETDGSVGAWGFDFDSLTLSPPDRGDLMGYCEARWIAPYTYKAFFDRIEALALPSAMRASTPRTYDRTRASADGTLARMTPVTLQRALSSPTKRVGVPGDRGVLRWVDAHVHGYDHHAGAVYYWER